MASKIVAPATATASATPPTLTGIPPGIQVSQAISWDTYTGSAESLIAAGILSAAQIPGGPGLPKTMATFYRGERVLRGTNGPRDEHHLQVRRAGRKLVVYIGLPIQERERRRALRDADYERERQRRNALEAERRALEDRAFRSNPDNLREQARMCLQMLTNLVENHISDLGQPQFHCRFSAEGGERAQDALRELAEWLEEVDVFAVDALAQELCAARLDKAFRSFMEVQCIGERL